MKSLISRITHIGWIKFTIQVFDCFGRDNGGLLAAGLAFFLVLAFIPMLLVGIAALGYWFHLIHDTGDAVQRIQNLLTTQVLPGAAGDEVKHLMERANVAVTVQKVTATRGIAGIVGLLGVIWAAMQIYINGSTAMNAAWETKETRSWIKLRLIALGLLVATGVLLVLSIAATAYGSWIAHHWHVGLAVTLLTEIGAVVVSCAMYAVTYKYLPAAHVSWRSAFMGGMMAAIAWEVAKKGLSVYLLHPNTSLYGNLANLIIFVLWVYYSMMILLLGAEASSVYSKEIEGARAAKLKRAASRKPASDTAVPAGSQVTNVKRRERV